MANIDFYQKEISRIQQQLMDKLDNLVMGLSELSDAELMKIGKQINFFDELVKEGYGGLVQNLRIAYEDEISDVFALLGVKKLSLVESVAISTLQELIDLEMDWLTTSVQGYANTLKTAMMRSLATGENPRQVIMSLKDDFGVGKYISSSRAEFLLQDSFARFSSSARAKAYENIPEQKFVYIGPNDGVTRPACQEALKLFSKPSTRSEIDSAGIPQFDGFINRGGFNCRHRFIAQGDEI